MFTPINLFESVQVTASTVTYYTSPVSASTSAAANTQNPIRTIIKKFTITNTDGSGAHAITVYLVPKGGTAGSTNAIISDKSVPAGADIDLYSLQGHVLETGDSIQMVASAATVLNARASGVWIQ